MQQQLETRDVTLFGTDELRVGEGNMPNKIVGLIPYQTLSVDLGGFKERLTPSAFSTTVRGSADVRALVDHNSEKLLGRTANGTVRIAEDAAGLRVEVDLPDTSYARDLRELVRRGDIKGMSFGFKVRPNGQRFVKENGLVVRELHDVDLREVSVVSLPAYADTTVATRSARIDTAVADLLKGLQIFPRVLAAKSRLLAQTM